MSYATAIAIIDHGRVLACDTPTNLKRMLQQQPVFEDRRDGNHRPQHWAASEHAGVAHVTGEAEQGGSSYKLNFHLADESAIASVINALTELNASIQLQKNEPTLEDVFSSCWSQP